MRNPLAIAPDGLGHGLPDVLGQVVQRDMHRGAGGTVGQFRGPGG